MSRKIRWIPAITLLSFVISAGAAAQNGARTGEPEELEPFLDSDRRGMAIRPPRSQHFVVMNVRVYGEGEKPVFEYRSMGEVVAVDTLNWPNGQYRYEISLVEDTRDRGITITARNSGGFSLQHGVIEMDPVESPGGLTANAGADRTDSAP